MHHQDKKVLPLISPIKAKSLEFAVNGRTRTSCRAQISIAKYQLPVQEWHLLWTRRNLVF